MDDTHLKVVCYSIVFVTIALIRYVFEFLYNHYKKNIEQNSKIVTIFLSVLIFLGLTFYIYWKFNISILLLSFLIFVSVILGGLFGFLINFLFIKNKKKNIKFLFLVPIFTIILSVVSFIIDGVDAFMGIIWFLIVGFLIFNVQKRTRTLSISCSLFYIIAICFFVFPFSNFIRYENAEWCWLFIISIYFFVIPLLTSPVITEQNCEVFNSKILESNLECQNINNTLYIDKLKNKKNQ